MIELACLMQQDTGVARRWRFRRVRCILNSKTVSNFELGRNVQCKLSLAKPTKVLECTTLNGAHELLYLKNIDIGVRMLKRTDRAET